MTWNVECRISKCGTAYLRRENALAIDASQSSTEVEKEEEPPVEPVYTFGVSLIIQAFVQIEL